MKKQKSLIYKKCFGVSLYFLFFLAAAYITSSSGDVVVDSGSSTTLQVIAGGIPSTITYVWKKNGFTIPGETSNTLTISSAGISDIGSYECIPSNSEGTHNTSVIQLDVKGYIMTKACYTL